jgi:5-bromo-4-chloroindolyl phosphate hydrolysis protein
MFKALKETPNQFSDLSRIECSDIDDSVDLSRKLISRLYDPKGKSKRCHIDLNKLRVKLATVKDSTLVILPPIASEDTFKQHVLRSSYQTKIWLNAHIPKPAVG